MIIKPNWPLSDKISAFCTTRMINGVSVSPYNQFNLAQHVGDDTQAVTQNRTILSKQFNLPTQPFWLNQIHSNIVLNLDKPIDTVDADASFTTTKKRVCAVMTADCLPILIADKSAKIVAAIHAGWRSLADGIIQNTIKQLNVPPHTLYAWLGPAISQKHFEVAHDVKAIFATQGFNTDKHFQQTTETTWLANLYGLATEQLHTLRINHIYGGEYCTYENSHLFYSYRREKQTGRMATLIWIN